MTQISDRTSVREQVRRDESAEWVRARDAGASEQHIWHRQQRQMRAQQAQLEQFAKQRAQPLPARLQRGIVRLREMESRHESQTGTDKKPKLTADEESIRQFNSHNNEIIRTRSHY